MDIHVFALALIAALYPVVICVRTNPLSSLVGKYWGRREVTHKSTQAEEINFALKEGQTIVAVLDETKAMCFYIGNDVIDVKDYE